MVLSIRRQPLTCLFRRENSVPSPFGSYWFGHFQWIAIQHLDPKSYTGEHQLGNSKGDQKLDGHSVKSKNTNRPTCGGTRHRTYLIWFRRPSRVARVLRFVGFRRHRLPLPSLARSLFRFRTLRSRMPRLLRAALGTVQPEACASALLSALSVLFDQHGWQTQLFCDRSVRTRENSGRLACGATCRFLDSWLMSPDLSREYFQYASVDCQVAIVAGRFQTEPAPPGASCGGTLEDLCDWLDLPRLAMLDVGRLVACHLPPRPSGIVGLLLDNVPRGELAHWRTTLESLWGVPVIGALPARAVNSQPTNGLAPRWGDGKMGDDEMIAANACQLAEQLGENLRLAQMLRLLDCGDLPRAIPWLYRTTDRLAGLTVAVAYDEAFYGYFSDVLDALELHGASVIDFSPLHDESLPPDTDIVYLGGGDPIPLADRLMKNQCLITSLRSHVCQGRRLYAEGGGLAYLCESVRMPLPSSQTGAGQQLPMAGVFPAVAVRCPETDAAARPVEVVLSRDHWLGLAGTSLRGYRDSAWRIEPFGSLASYVANPGCELDLVGRHQAIGSRLQLDFAAQPNFLEQFSPAESSSARIERSRS